MAALGRVIIAHTLAHTRAAFGAAQAVQTPLVLQTATGALRFAGGQYLLSLFQKVQNEFPDVKALLILECDDAGAETVSAMRIGHTHIRSSAPDALRVKLVDIAQQLGVVVADDVPEVLDLRFTYYVDDACKKWLGHVSVTLE